MDRLGNECFLLRHYDLAFVLLTKVLIVNQRSYPSIMGLGIAVFRPNQTDRTTNIFGPRPNSKPRRGTHAFAWASGCKREELPESLKSLIKANVLHRQTAEVLWLLARVYENKNHLQNPRTNLLRLYSS